MRARLDDASAAPGRWHLPLPLPHMFTRIHACVTNHILARVRAAAHKEEGLAGFAATVMVTEVRPRQ